MYSTAKRTKNQNQTNFLLFSYKTFYMRAILTAFLVKQTLTFYKIYLIKKTQKILL